MPPELDRVELYTDGACSGNPGPGGWAYILKNPATGRTSEASGGEGATTNNRMELMAAIKGLRAIRTRSRVDLFSDSQYVINGLKEWLDGWKAKSWKRGRNEPVKNVELWKELDGLRHQHELTYHWIRGHNEHPENERCDELAVRAIARHSSPRKEVESE